MRRRSRPQGAAAVFHGAGGPSGSSPWREARWCAVDLELTGLDPCRHHIIAVGAVPVEEGRVSLSRARYTLVRPTHPLDPALGDHLAGLVGMSKRAG